MCVKFTAMPVIRHVHGWVTGEHYGNFHFIFKASFGTDKQVKKVKMKVEMNLKMKTIKVIRGY